MSDMYRAGPPRPRPPILNGGRLWAGGLATALVAALIAIAGVLVGRGVFGVEILAPKGRGVWGDADTFWYALGAAFMAILATGLIQLLILTTPKPMRFFGWVIGLATVVAMLLPFVTDGDRASRFYTAGLNLVLGVAIGTLVAGVARSALRPAAGQPQYR
ncbi:DUF6069 family protein [Paractinoplanes rishiriensis]|uniref:Uncharacterized protein n=1 Tax=Paractinoplanes rishiriensis TaxID=1050105 RepID=A0A919MZM1_9ACTN|nr:DUF6069 family protein [Actinoplanes rishiriensis]GIE98495.1 hypothetical protein Ari01nite_59600 [Actinoplanes rishiriensis]